MMVEIALANEAYPNLPDEVPPWSGEWWFETRGDSTLVRWTYTFEPRSLPRAPLAFAFGRLLWKGYMERAMREAKAQAEVASRRAG